MLKKSQVTLFILGLLLAQVSWAQEVRKVPWNWIYTLGTTSLFINKIYWMMSQNSAIARINFADLEDSIPEDQKTCGPICRYHSRQIFEKTKDIVNINMVTAAMSGLGLLFNSAALILLAMNDERFNTFSNIVTGTSVVASWMNWASFSKMLDIEIWHRVYELPISMKARVDQAATYSLAYLLPAIPVSGYGLVFLAKTAHLAYLQLRQSLSVTDTYKLPDKIE